MAGNIISRLLDTNGNGTGDVEAVGKYSDGELGSTDFFIAPAAGETFIIHRMMVSYAAAKNWSADLYGKAITLTNGIKVLVEDSDGLMYELTDHTVKTNGQWAAFCYDFTLFAFGSGNDWAAVRWTFAKSGKPVILRGDYGQKLIVRLNDDFDDLVEQHFLVQGYQVI